MRIEELLSRRTQGWWDVLIAKHDFSEVANDKGWTSFMDYSSGRIQIGYDEQDWREAALAHELLHMSLEEDGFRRPVFVATNEVCAELVGFLFNYVSHLAMSRKFLASGFEANEFLRDSDAEDLQRIANDIGELERRSASRGEAPGLAILMAFCGCNTPGIQPGRRRRMLKRLRRVAPPGIVTELEKCSRAFADGSETRASVAIGRLLRVVGVPARLAEWDTPTGESLDRSPEDRT